MSSPQTRNSIQSLGSCERVGTKEEIRWNKVLQESRVGEKMGNKPEESGEVENTPIKNRLCSIIGKGSSTFLESAKKHLLDPNSRDEEKESSAGGGREG
jgi:hypothetical protein